jgi:uracil-DNA glycosylase
MMPHLPASWRSLLSAELKRPYFRALQQFLATELQGHTIYPQEKDIFSALCFTHFDNVRVLLMGQDPYPSKGHAHGLSFSVLPGVKFPGSLINIFKELQEDVSFRIPNNGYLEPWARQGVLMLNSVLTVRAGEPNSHKDKGWEVFTDAIVKKVNDKNNSIVFVLWGTYAQKKIPLIDAGRHTIVRCAHPSMLTANEGFFGCRSFSAINEALRAKGEPEINWQIPDI